MVMESPSLSASKVIFISRGDWLLSDVALGSKMTGVGTKFCTVMMKGGLWFRLLEVSFTTMVKFSTAPLDEVMVKFCEHWSLFPATVLLRIRNSPLAESFV